jgi:chitinase
MKSWLRVLVIFAAAVFTVSSSSRAQARATSDKWVSGFYVGYMSESYPPAAIDFESLTHVMVFSVLPKTNGTLDTALFIDAINGPKIAQEVAQRAHAAGKKAILTLGGSDTEAGFRSSTSARNRSNFVRNIVQLVNTWGFDGVDIDWEPLPPEDYNAVLALVSALKAAKPGIILTADVAWQNSNFPIDAIDARFYVTLASALDQMNMMTYEMADNWGGWVVWHSSAVFGDGPDHPSSVHSTAAQYLDAGVPPAKLGIGIGFFGSCWSAPAGFPLQLAAESMVVASDNDIGFANVKNTYYDPRSYHYDANADGAYLSFQGPVGPSKCTFISYEDETSVAAKGRYAGLTGLGGAMIWQLNEGYNPEESDPSSLLHAVGRAFLTPRSEGLSEPTRRR